MRRLAATDHQATKPPRHQSEVNIIKSLGLSIVSAFLLSLPFLNGKLWIFAWFGFVPLFFALRDKSRARAFLLSYLTGIIFWSISIYWLIHVTLLGQILLILYLSLYFGIFGLVLSRIPHPASRIPQLFVPSLWVILEYLRAHLLTGFGWALLGYSQYLNLPVIQIADLCGVYGVSFLVMMVNIGTWQLISENREQRTENRKKIFCLLSVVSCLLVALAYGYYNLFHPSSLVPRPSFKISVIQGNIPQELKWAYGSQPFILDRYIQLTEEAAKEGPQVIIWPEASNPGLLGDEQDEWIRQAVFSLAKKTGIPLLFGSALREREKYFNSAILIDAQGKLARRYDKLHLVPFGEYIPLKTLFPFLEAVVPIGDFTVGGEYILFKLPVASGQLLETTHLSPVTGHRSLVTFSVLICFEDTIPELSRNFVKKGADFLVNITNDAWFGRTVAPYQHLSASVFRAIENRIPVIRSANTGVSCFIHPSGSVDAKVSENGNDIFISGVKTETIVLDKRKSLYQAIGDMFVLGCLAMVGIYGIIAKSNNI